MDYEKARDYAIMRFEGHLDDWGLLLQLYIGDNRINEGLAEIKSLTSCDDDTAKLIWTDLEHRYIELFGEDTLKKEREEAIEEARRNAASPVYGCVPRCPTCGSTNLKRLNPLFQGWNPKQFRCNNCGYEW